MSDIQQPIEERRAEDIKPTQLPSESVAPTESAAPVHVPETEKRNDDVTALPVAEHVHSGEPALTTDNKVEDPVNQAAQTTETAGLASAKVAEPVTSGVLGYKAPGLLKQLKFSKRYFWLADEPISSQNLSHFLRGTEPKTAHPVAAWSSHTGKGLLCLVKAEADKSHPQDILLLADATDLTKIFPHEFSFKIHGHKHTFKAENEAERDGWYISLENAITEAKGSKEHVVKSDKYQDTIKHLGAPSAAAAAGTAGAVGAAKVHEHKEETAEPRAVEPIAEVPARTGSSSDEDIEKRKKNQSRSVSRNKRSSIFGAFKNKKDDLEIKKEEKKIEKEEKKEEKAEAHDPHTHNHAAEAAAVGVPATGAATAVAATEEPRTIDTVAEPKTETVKDVQPETSREAAPKTGKRNSIFGSIYQKVRSPAVEKKEHEVGPAVPPKDSTAPQLDEPVSTPDETFQDAHETKVTEPLESKPDWVASAVAPVAAAEPTTATSVEPTAPVSTKTEKVHTPKKEKESFLGGLLSKARAKSPATGKREEKKETSPIVPTAATDAPAVPPKDEFTTEAPATIDTPLDSKVETAGASAPAATAVTDTETKADEPIAPVTDKEAPVISPKDTRRRSYFGSLGQKKEKTEGENGETEKPLGKFSSIFRRPSQAVRGSDVTPRKENAVPEKVEEPIAETKPETTLPESEFAKSDEKAVNGDEQQNFGDVVPEAVTVGQSQQTSNPAVSATA